MEYVEFGATYSAALFSNWLWLALGLLGLNELSEWLLHRSIRLLRSHRIAIAVGLLVIAQTIAYRSLQQEYGALQARVGVGVRLPLPAFVIGEHGLQYGGTFPNEWRRVQGPQEVLLDWGAISETSNVFLEVTVGFAGPALSETDKGIRLRLRDMETDHVIGVSEWIAVPNEFPRSSRTRFALDRQEGQRRYVLEAEGETQDAIHTFTARGVLIAE